MNIDSYYQCNECIHKETCKYSDDVRKAAKEVREKASNYSVFNDIVVFECHCKLYRHNNPAIR